jgi:hypothetical protein
MIPLSYVKWGPTDALARDSQFSDKWTEPEDIKICLAGDKWLISGEKGSGKSAIRRALTEIYGARYLAAPVVDFNDITFKVLYEHLVALASTTKLSKTATLSHFWQYALIIELIVAAADKAPDRYVDLLAAIPTARAAVPLNERLVRLLEEAWNKIDDFTGMKARKKPNPKARRANLVASSGLTAKLLDQLSKFPLGHEHSELKLKFFNRIESNGDRLVLVLDGFDRLKNDGANSSATKLIFASLVDAVQTLRSDRNLPGSLELKVFIPHDRYLALPLRDSDKVDTMHAAIRWTRPSLKEFLKRRLDLTPKLAQVSAGNFNALWRQVIPEQITNNHYRIEEETFDYIVRHSMFRPRQVQIHLEHIGSQYPDRNIDPSMVPRAISESSKKIAKYFIDEFVSDHPSLGRFVSAFHRKDNVFEYRYFRSVIADKLGPKDVDLVLEDKVDTLYAMGMFGVVNFIEPGSEVGDVYCPPTKESRRHFVDFFFKNPHPSISGTLKDDSIIAFHPVFADYCNLRPHPSLIVG